MKNKMLFWNCDVFKDGIYDNIFADRNLNELKTRTCFFVGYNNIATASLVMLNVIYHPLYGMNDFVTNKSNLPQDGAPVFPYMGWLAIMWEGYMIANHPI